MAVIHRFMAASRNQNEELLIPGVSIDMDTLKTTSDEHRLRKTSERSDVVSEDSPMQHSVAIVTRRKQPIVRSLTEVRPDAYIFDDGMHVEVRNKLEEEDECESNSKSENFLYKILILCQ